MRPHTAAVTAISAALVVSAIGLPSASADIQQPAIVSANPVDNTPHVLDGTVRAVAVVGSKVVVGGTFEKVREAGSGKPEIARKNIFAYDMGTGKVDTTFKPALNGVVHALEIGDSNTVYAGGTFTTVNGGSTGTLAKLAVPSGSVVTAFKPAVNYRVFTMVRRGGQVYIGGLFTKAGGKSRSMVARLNATSGAADDAFNFTVSDPRSGAIKVYRLAVNPQNTRLLINGTFTKVNGQRRMQIAMINTDGSKAALSSWATESYSAKCGSSFDTYMRGMDFSPDGKYFVVVTTGGPYGNTTLCDTAARWETSKTGSGQKPTWVNWTGGDTLLSTSATGATVYVGGHQRWLDNPYGHDTPGPGAVSRPGIGSINPTTGKATSWNPTRTLGHGVEALVGHQKGLLVASDTDQLGHEYHGRLGMFPLP